MMDEKVRFFRLITAIQGIKFHLKGMKLTRIATPALLRDIATEYTGKVYPRSRKGLLAALADMEAHRDAWLARRKAEAEAQPVA